MKNFLKVSGLILLLIVLALVVLFIIKNERLPNGIVSQDADTLADKMLEAVNMEAWEQTHYIAWTFKDVHHFVWDKKRKLVKVKWEDVEVDLNLKRLSEGKVMVNSKTLTGEKKQQYLEKAWKYFANDSFWLIAPLKVYDEGVVRSIVNINEHQKGLLVTYEKGGVTPGDSYLWVLGEDNLPIYYKMWVSIIPIGGVKATWSNWEKMPTGVMLPTNHQLSFLSLPITKLNTGYTYQDLKFSEDPFMTFYE